MILLQMFSQLSISKFIIGKSIAKITKKIRKMQLSKTLHVRFCIF